MNTSSDNIDEITVPTLFEEDESYSQEKNNLIRDLNRVHLAISNAGIFSQSYDTIVNGGIISGIQERCEDYVKRGKYSVLCDVVDGVIQSLNFNELADTAKKNIHNKVLPSNTLKYRSLPSLDEYDIEEYDTDSIVNMWSNIPTSKTMTKKAIKDAHEYSKYKKISEQYIHAFMDQFDNFESDLNKYRIDAIEIMKSNVPYIANEYYRQIFNATQKHQKLSDIISINGINVKFYKTQTEFLKNAIKNLILNK